MTFEEWIYEVISTGNICNGYDEKVNNSMNDEDLMKIVLDANGISYLPQMQQKGIPLPYEIITTRFAPFINGRYTAEFTNGKGNGYDSSLYCCFEGNEIVANTTCLCILGYSGTLIIPENNFVEVYLDANCDIEVKCLANARGIIHYWGNNTPKIKSGKKGIILIKEKL